MYPAHISARFRYYLLNSSTVPVLPVPANTSQSNQQPGSSTTYTVAYQIQTRSSANNTDTVILLARSRYYLLDSSTVPVIPVPASTSQPDQQPGSGTTYAVAGQIQPSSSTNSTDTVILLARFRYYLLNSSTVPVIPVPASQASQSDQQPGAGTTYAVAEQIQPGSSTSSADTAILLARPQCCYW